MGGERRSWNGKGKGRGQRGDGKGKGKKHSKQNVGIVKFS